MYRRKEEAEEHTLGFEVKHKQYIILFKTNTQLEW